MLRNRANKKRWECFTPSALLAVGFVFGFSAPLLADTFQEECLAEQEQIRFKIALGMKQFEVQDIIGLANALSLDAENKRLISIYDSAEISYNHKNRVVDIKYTPENCKKHKI